MDDIEYHNPEWDSISLILVGTGFGRLRDNQKITDKTKIKLLPLNFEALRSVCSIRLDNFLNLQGIYASSSQREVTISFLVDKLEDKAIVSRIIERSELVNWINTSLQNQTSNFLKQEIEEVDNFKKLFGKKQTDRNLRIAILDFYQKSSLKNLHLVIKSAEQFLSYDKSNKLTVEIGWFWYIVNSFFIIWGSILFLMGIYLGILELSHPPSASSLLMRSIILIIFIMTVPVMIVIDPFVQALRIKHDIIKRVGSLRTSNGDSAIGN